jgi:parallel beta-helix repeat protein
LTPPTSSHVVKNNKITAPNGWGLNLVNAGSNTFTGNWIQKSVYGVYISSASSNTFYRNNFVNNLRQVHNGGTGNLWDKDGEGNYWSDYNGTGIYRLLPSGADNHPLNTTWSERDIAILNVSSSRVKVNYGSTVDITVKVRNNANTSVSETFTVTAKYNSNNIETKTISNLAQGATQILTFNWNTTGVASGNYTISAEATPVPDELNTDDNIHSDGTVLVTIGDFDHDGDVDGVDFGMFAPCYGSSLGQPTYNREADFNNDGHIDGVDFGTLAPLYGKIW